MLLVQELPEGVRRDLLRILESPSNVRADAIRQFHERGDEGMVDVLVDLEADDTLRLGAVATLRASLPSE